MGVHILANKECWHLRGRRWRVSVWVQGQPNLQRSSRTARTTQRNPVSNKQISQAVVVPTFNSSTQETKADICLWVLVQPGLQSKFHNSQGYTEKPCSLQVFTSPSSPLSKDKQGIKLGALHILEKPELSSQSFHKYYEVFFSKHSRRIVTGTQNCKGSMTQCLPHVQDPGFNLWKWMK